MAAKRKPRYSIFSLARNSMSHHQGWEKAWRSPEPKPEYDVVIVGAGGHGLATAYYLAKNHGITNIAVVEKGWLGGGNTGRNTTIIRSNYLQDSSAALFELSRTEWADTKRVKELCPIINTDPNSRFPVLGGLWQPRGGTARHDAVAWGYARAADDLGVDVIQNCEVLGIDREGGKVTGVQTTRGAIKCGKLGIVVAGNTTRLTDMAGFRMPLESVPLQALVSEPIKPCLDIVVMANTVHGYMSQSDKGELVIGGGTDGYNAYTQRGSFHHIEETVTALVETFPIISRLRMLRQWGGIVDITGDRSPIISKTPVDGVFVNCGWGTGGFKATCGSGHCFAATIARGEPDHIAAPFSLDRFTEGRMIDESVAAAVAH